MRYLSNQRYQVWFPGPDSWELWLINGWNDCRLLERGKQSDELQFHKGSQTKVLALPVSAVESHNFVSTASGEKKLYHDAREFLENRTGVSNPGCGVQPVCGSLPHTFCRIDRVREEINDLQFPENLLPDQIVPAVSLLPLPRRSMVVWEELGRSVIAFERNGLTAAYDDVTGQWEISIVRKVRRLFRTIESNEVVERVRSLHLWKETNIDLFEDQLNIPVYQGDRPEPTNRHSSIGIRHDSFRSNAAVHGKKIRKRRFLLGSGLGASLLIAIIWSVHAFSDAQIRDLEDQHAALQSETGQIDKFKSAWNDVAASVDRDASVLETWRKLTSLPSSRQIKIDRLAIAEKGVALTCQAASKNTALSYIDDVRKTASLDRYSWDHGGLEILQDGTALFVLKGQK